MDLDDENIIRDLLGEEEDGSDDGDKAQSIGSSSAIPDEEIASSQSIAITKGKRPIRFDNTQQQKKLKLSLGDSFLAANIAKNKLDNFRWMEERKDKEKQKIVENKIELMRAETEAIKAKTEKTLAKVAMLKVLNDLGMSQQEIMEQVKDL